MREDEIQESGKIFALTMVLMNVLILTAIGGVFWIGQMTFSQAHQFNVLLNGFRT